MNSSLQVILEEQRVAKDNAAKLIEAFGAPFTEAGEILSNYTDIVVTDETQKDQMAIAREKRLTLKRIRTGVENKRKELKEDSLRTGKAIDGVAKYIRDTIQPAEEYLELQEKFAEIKAAERAAELKAQRVAELSKYTDELSLYNIDGMTDEKFATLIEQLKADQVAKLEAERLAKEAAAKMEAERVAEELRIRAENERLRAEALVEREKREALEAEQRAQQAAAEKVKADQEAATHAALLAPDKDKLLQFRDALEVIRTEKLPQVTSAEAKRVTILIDEMLRKMQTVITEKANQL